MAGTAYHIPGTNDPKKTVCGRPIEVNGRPQVLLTTNAEKKKGTVCGRCKALKAGQARTEKIKAKHERIRVASPHKKIVKEAESGFVADVPYNPPPKANKRKPALLVLGERMPEKLHVTFKGQEHLATVGVDGSIVVVGQGQTYFSPSRAGKAVAGREVDGWTFWSFRNVAGELEKLDALRKAVA